MHKFIFSVLLASSCLFACQPETPAVGGDLDDLYHNWTLLGIEQNNQWEAVPDELSALSLELDAQLEAYFRSSCNQGRGTYTADRKGNIDFPDGAITQVYCGQLGAQWENLYFQSLSAVNKFSVADNQLRLLNDSLSLRFER